MRKGGATGGWQLSALAFALWRRRLCAVCPLLASTLPTPDPSTLQVGEPAAAAAAPKAAISAAPKAPAIKLLQALLPLLLVVLAAALYKVYV